MSINAASVFGETSNHPVTLKQGGCFIILSLIEFLKRVKQAQGHGLGREEGGHVFSLGCDIMEGNKPPTFPITVRLAGLLHLQIL